MAQGAPLRGTAMRLKYRSARGPQVELLSKQACVAMFFCNSLCVRPIHWYRELLQAPCCWAFIGTCQGFSKFRIQR